MRAPGWPAISPEQARHHLRWWARLARSSRVAVRSQRLLAEGRGPCYEWQPKPNSSGYGLVRCGGKERKVSVHRLAKFLADGPIPKRMMVLHECDNKICWNPDHLSVGTQSANMQAHWYRQRKPSHFSEQGDWL